jgi:hypothetical protein
VLHFVAFCEGSQYEPEDTALMKQQGKHYLDDVPSGALKNVLREVLPREAASQKLWKQASGESLSSTASSASSAVSLNSGTSDAASAVAGSGSASVDIERRERNRLDNLKEMPTRRAPKLGQAARKAHLAEVER